MRAEPYEAAAAEEWDALVAAAPMGTLLHSRRFLGYHGDRFEDASILLRDDSDRLLGVLPAAIDPADRATVASHPGVTFGGIVHDGRLGGPAMMDALTLVAQHYAERGFSRLRYAPVPTAPRGTRGLEAPRLDAVARLVVMTGSRRCAPCTAQASPPNSSAPGRGARGRSRPAQQRCGDARPERRASHTRASYPRSSSEPRSSGPTTPQRPAG